MPVRRIAIVGGTAAGPAAAAQAARTAPGADVLLFEQGPHVSVATCEMPYLVSGDVARAQDLVVLTPEALRREKGVQAFVRHRVVAAEPRRGRVHVEDLARGTVRAERVDAVVLATGAVARWPDGDDANGANLFVLRSLTDAAALRAYAETTPVRHAVVLGAGYVGVEVAEALVARGLRVSILDPGGLLSRYLCAELQPVVEAAVRAAGVQVRMERVVRFRHGTDGRITSVDTDRGERIGCDLVVAALGVTPDVALGVAAGARLGATGAFAVDSAQRTNVPGLWACGDCAESVHAVTRRPTWWPLSNTAFRSGRVAGENAGRRGAGAPARTPPVVGTSGVRAFGIEVAATGLDLSAAEAAGFDAFTVTKEQGSRASHVPGGSPVHVRLVVERPTGRLLGGMLVGAEGAALRLNTLVPLVADAATVADLLDLDLVYHPALAPAHDPLHVAAVEAVRVRERANKARFGR